MKTTGKIIDISKNLITHKLRVMVEIDYPDDIETIQTEFLDITMKKHSPRRSLDQNALAWVFIDKLAECVGIKKEQVYQYLIKQLGGCSKTICSRVEDVDFIRDAWTVKGLGWQVEAYPSKLEGCMNVTLYPGSSVFSKDQMRRFIELIIQECDQLNIDTKPLREVSLLETR
ncbi:MAG: hypothetical protein MJ236_04710 [Clostridia bacterium]|nr:hypothetical protein [Clostridia bacterium]